MKAGAAAKRYARAVFSLGVESGKFEKIGQEIQAVVSAVEGDESLRNILLNPQYDAAARQAVMKGLSSQKAFASITVNLLFLLIDKDRFSILPDILRYYQELSDEKAGRIKAAVVTASAMSEQLMKELTDSIVKKTGKKVTLSSGVDPGLIGGSVLKIGDIVYDGSIRTQIQAIKDNIRKAA